MEGKLKDIRCKCGKLLCKAHGIATIEVKCSRCKEIELREINDVLEVSENAAELIGGND